MAKRQHKSNRSRSSTAQSALAALPTAACLPLNKAAFTWRQWFFRLLALTLVPLVLLMVLELVLRALGFGDPTHFFIKSRLQNQTVYVENQKFGRRFFRPLWCGLHSPT